MDNLLLLTYLTIVSGIMAFVLSYVAWANQAISGMRSFAVMMLVTGIWALATASMSSTLSPDEQLMLQKVIMVVNIIFYVAWAFFATAYYGWNLRYWRWVILIIPIISTLLALTFDQHTLFYSSYTFDANLNLQLEPAIGWMINVVYGMGLYLLGIYVLLVFSIRSVSYNRNQIRFMLIASLIPFVGTILTLLYNYPHFIPISLVISNLIIISYVLRLDTNSSTSISYETVIENLANAILVMDVKYNILATNEKIEQYISTPHSKLAGKSINEVFAQYPDVIDAIQIEDTHLPYRTFSLANRQYIELLKSEIRDDKKTKTGYVVTLLNITNRINVENALKANERRYRTLFENASDAIFIISMKFKIEYVNQRACELLGMNPKEMIGKSSDTYIKQDETQDSQIRLQNVLDTGESTLYERTFITAEGVEVPCEVSLSIVNDEDGKPLHIQTIVRDISERIQTQRELQNHVNQMNILRQVDEEINTSLAIDNVLMVALDAVVRLSQADIGFIALVKDEDIIVSRVVGDYRDVIGNSIRYDLGISGRVLVNQEPELVLDVTSDPDYFEDVEGMQAAMILPIISQDRLLGLVGLETVDRTRFTEETYSFIQVIVSRVASALDNANLYEYVRNQLADSENLNQELRLLESLKTDMIRIASHDLKNPLAIVRGYVEMLKLEFENLEPNQVDYVIEIQKSVKRMETILQDILNLERIKQSAFAQQRFNLAHQVNKGIEEYKSQAQNKSQQLIADVDDDLPMIQGDTPQIFEALTNLISNAIKYTPDAGKIEVKLFAQDTLTPFEEQIIGSTPDNAPNQEDSNIRNWAIYQVIDNGYGIPNDRKHRMFEPFYRAKVDGTEHIEGTGLGLHLVKNIIERHNGRMLFSSEYKQGSIFGFVLPTASPVDIIDESQPTPSNNLPDVTTPIKDNDSQPTSFFDDI